MCAARYNRHNRSHHGGAYGKIPAVSEQHHSCGYALVEFLEKIRKLSFKDAVGSSPTAVATEYGKHIKVALVNGQVFYQMFPNTLKPLRLLGRKPSAFGYFHQR